MSALGYCSFCGKSEADVGALIAGPQMVFICDACVTRCVDIIAEWRAKRAAQAAVTAALADAKPVSIWSRWLRFCARGGAS